MEKIIYPPAEVPVNIKNFLSFPSTFCFRVKNIKTPPNKSRRAPEIIIKRKLMDPLNAGMNIVPAITTKTPTNRYNITVNIFPLIFIDYILPRARKVAAFEGPIMRPAPRDNTKKAWGNFLGLFVYFSNF